MRIVALIASVTAPLLANAETNAPIKFNCDVSHIHAFNSDGMPFQALENDTKAQYVVTIENDLIRADMRSKSRKEVVVYRVLMHNSSEYIGALAPVKSSSAAIAVSKEPNAIDIYSGTVTAIAGTSIKVTALLCLKAKQ